MALVKCNWTEHISPEGFKYYYNSVTGESRVGIYLSCHYFSYFNYTCGTNVHWNQPTVGETWGVGIIWTEKATAKAICSAVSNSVTTFNTTCPASSPNPTCSAPKSSPRTSSPPATNTASFFFVFFGKHLTYWRTPFWHWKVILYYWLSFGPILVPGIWSYGPSKCSGNTILVNICLTVIKALYDVPRGLCM